MAETLLVPKDAGREDKYRSLLPQIEALVSGEKDMVANLANISAALRQTFGFFWTGFYLFKANELVLGPFQGDIACTRITPGKGVCGTAFALKQTQLVPDVEQFPGHIACSALSRSEIVVPVVVEGQCVMVLDIDSDRLNDFNETDLVYLEALAKMIATNYNQWN